MPKDGSGTRTRILDAAEQLVERNGFAATSVDQILVAAGSSKGAFFHHFDSKRDLAAALVDRYVDADLDLLRPALEAAGDPDVDIEALADHLFATFEGGYLLCRSLRSAEPMRTQLRVLRQLVAALLRR